MKFFISIIYALLLTLLINSTTQANTTWITAPTAYYTIKGMEGLDGIRGTSDDLPGPDGILGTIDDYGPDLLPGTLDDPSGGAIYSGFTGGSYLPDSQQYPGADLPLSASVSMISTIYQIGPKTWSYKWTITNEGTGPFVEYFDTGNGPNFLQDSPLYGTAGENRIIGDFDDVPPETEIDTRTGGPPTTGRWGGRWNPEVGTEVPRYEPIPDPASIILVCWGLAAIAITKKHRILN